MKYLTPLLLLVVSLYSCKTKEPDTLKVTDIQGQYTLIEAFRSGQLTKTLAGLEFNFYPDGSMMTNLMGVDQSATYDLEDRTIHTTLPEPSSLNVMEVLGDTLILSTTIRDYNFKFILNKQKNNE